MLGESIAGLVGGSRFAHRTIAIDAPCANLFKDMGLRRSSAGMCAALRRKKHLAQPSAVFLGEVSRGSRHGQDYAQRQIASYAGAVG